MITLTMTEGEPMTNATMDLDIKLAQVKMRRLISDAERLKATVNECNRALERMFKLVERSRAMRIDPPPDTP